MPRILVIEDDDADAELVASMLRPADIVMAKSMDDGIRRLNEGGFDAVILDLSLPDSHGIDSVATTHLFDCETPIIVLTGLDDEATAMQALREGAHEVLVKGRTDQRRLQRALDNARKRLHVEERMPQRPRKDVEARGVLVPPGGGLIESLATHVQGLGKVLYVAADRPSAVVQRSMSKRGISQLVTLDAGHDPDRLAIEVEEAVAEGGIDWVIVDNFGSLMLRHGLDPATLLCHTLANRLRLLGVPVDFVVYDNQEWPFIADRLAFLDGFLDIAPERPSDPSFA